jgi:subtilisin family serine protease
MSRPVLRTALVAVALLGVAASPGAVAALPSLGSPEAAAAKPRLLVTFDDAPAAAEVRGRLAGLGAIVPVLPEAGVWSLAATDPARARDRVLARPAVAGAEWSLARRTDERPRPPPPTPRGPPPAFTDPFFNATAQWGLLASRSTWGAELTTPAVRPRIAILDSGVDRTHEEWAGAPSPLVAPRSTLRGDGDAVDVAESGHGTHVTGIAAAPANGVGVVGVAPASAGAAEVIPVQIADRVGRSSDLTMIRGIRHAVRNGAKVVNISAGGDGYSQAFQDAILWATRQGALIVASVGNDYGDALNYPAAYRHVVGVGAQCDDQVSAECPRPFGVAEFSNRNRSVDVIAPGVNVLSSVPRRVTERAVRGGYALKDGTSMSAPYVAGVAALVMASNGNSLSPYQVLRQIENTAVDLGPAGRDDATGYGAVNARAAVVLQAPADDEAEVNDDVKWLSSVQRLSQIREPLAVEARVDHYDDRDDVYAVRMNRGERVRVRLVYADGQVDLSLFRPGTTTVRLSSPSAGRNRITSRRGDRNAKTISYTAKKNGRHFVVVTARSGGTDYTVTLERLGQR